MLEQKGTRLFSRGLIGLALAGTALGAAQVSGQEAPAVDTPADGVHSWYTEEQAETGFGTYTRYCEACHGDALVGGVGGGPPLAGDYFYSLWGDLPLDALFEYIKLTMPQDQPGILSNTQVANTMAYILQFNGFPAGSEPLPSDSTELQSIILTRPE